MENRKNPPGEEGGAFQADGTARVRTLRRGRVWGGQRTESRPTWLTLGEQGVGRGIRPGGGGGFPKPCSGSSQG